MNATAAKIEDAEDAMKAALAGQITPGTVRVREMGKGAQGITGLMTGDWKPTNSGWRRYAIVADTDQSIRWISFFQLVEVIEPES